MTIVALTLLAFGVGDIAAGILGGTDAFADAAAPADAGTSADAATPADAGAPDRPRDRLQIAIACLAALTVGAGYLAGFGGPEPWLTAVALGAVLYVWLLPACTPARSGRIAILYTPRFQLLWVLAAVATAFVLSGSFAPVHGPFAQWYRALPIHGGDNHASATQALLAITGAVFLLVTTNRIVRLTLESVHSKQPAGTATLLEKGESTLRGGRYIGAIERLIVAALLLSGSLAGAGIIIAAKGFIRLPEIRSADALSEGAGDSVAEYFLIGTLTSIVVAAVLALLVLAA